MVNISTGTKAMITLKCTPTCIISGNDKICIENYESTEELQQNLP